ncbi:DUF3883 domain-containing protein [uncultured Tateyamaria sp.]|uniref:DUF3883 domain-containing protein n=1 Tax=uncultured Tateyamaria sp. TaxID=455651 RepID=UPI0026116A99|nr:DUF3883 domain-containing protein [uncultured Tateyamaria sp.]
MPERIAVKRLTQSDLTFVDWHFQQKTFGESRQKAINLNRDVLVDSLFPDLANNPQARMDVLLTVYGPGGAPAFTPPIPTRPILNNNAKNWRLNGQTLPDDPSIPNRFHDLKPDDLALMVFRGWPKPSEIDLTFVSSVEDAAVHSVLEPLIGQGRQSMAAVTRDALHALLNQVNLENDHPLSSILEEDKPENVQSAIEEAIHGGAASNILRRRRGGPKLTPVELAEARERASEIGSDGEKILYGWLRSQEDAGHIKDLDWVARRDAAAPYDFTFERPGQLVQLDAKSTNGPFSRKFHVSYSELIAAAESSSYSIARVYELSEHGAKVRLFSDFQNTAKEILASTSLPDGVEPTGFSIASATLAFEPEFNVEWILDA